MKVVIEVLAAPTMLGEACSAGMAFAIMANATEVPSGRIGEEDVGTEVDGLSRSFEAPTSTRAPRQDETSRPDTENRSPFCL
jgi:hypothetical protein